MKDHESNIIRLTKDGQDYGIIIRTRMMPNKTTFYTENDATLQVGHIVRRKGERVPAHQHKPQMRTLTETSEVLYIKQGRCKLTIYDKNRDVVVVSELTQNDILMLYAKEGHGHSLEALEDLVMLEVKQGPYAGTDEKIYI